MKLITLNTWGGRAGKKNLLDFFKKHKDIDVFCLQEIWSGSYDNFEGALAGGIPISHEEIMTHGMQDISAALEAHKEYFRPHFMDSYGLMILAKKDLEIISEGELYVYKEKGHIPDGDLGSHARNIQSVSIKYGDDLLNVFNFHGLWNGRDKEDSEDRINQSKKIIDYINSFDGKKILCGDFNLAPHTQSIKMIEDIPMKNLIKEYDIKSTRTHHYKKEVRFADYIFITNNVEVKEFKVLPDIVSDHLPLYLEFN